VLNLGDTTGTSKGPKYHAKNYGGFTITVDDLLKSTDSAFSRNLKQETLSNLIRSYEAGAGAIARVNKADNRVEASESGTLHSNPRITSEIVPDAGSTLDRLILLPYLDKEYGSGIFDRPLGWRLNQPETIECQHHAFSAYVCWAWSRRSQIFDTLHSKATAITDGWELSNSRLTDRYAAIITGLLAFETYATETAVTEALTAQVSAHVGAGIEALRRCAQAQGKRQEPLDMLVRDRLRQMLTAHRIAIPGRPTVGPDGTQDSNYTLPWQTQVIETDTGIPEVRNEMPPGVTGYQDLGMVFGRGSDDPIKVPERAVIVGYLRPPKPQGEPGRRDELSDDWVIILPEPNGMFATLCQELTNYSRNIDGHVFGKSEIADMLIAKGYGKRKYSRWHIGTGKYGVKTCMIIKASYLFGNEDI
jgi:hypothetical protein